MADTYYVADLWCDVTNWGNPDTARYCKLAAREGMTGADTMMYPRPPQPATIPPPPLTSSGNSAIPYDTIQDYLIAAQKANQRVRTQDFFGNVASELGTEVSTGTNWLTIGILAVVGYLVVKKVL